VYPIKELATQDDSSDLRRFIPSLIWKMLDVRPKINLERDFRNAVYSPSYFALETVKFLVEEAHCPRSQLELVDCSWIAKNVNSYLREKADNLR
jgi:hypothetical protein